MPNTFVGKGNLGDSPSTKHLVISGENRTVTEFRVFFDEYKRDHEGEFEQSGGIWLNVSVWDERGEELARLLQRGARIKVEGRLREFTYNAKGNHTLPDGEIIEVQIPVSGFQILADDVTLALNRVESVQFKPKAERQTSPA